MFDSSWNSAAFQRFCGEFVIVRNGDRNAWIIVETASGNIIGKEYHSQEQAEEYRRQIYDNQ